MGRRNTIIAVLAGCLLLLFLAHLLRGGGERLNVILISIDTLRADHLGCYGHRAIHTPNIDRLAARAVVFDRCFSCVPITLPAHCSMLTGMYPPKHSVRINYGFTLPGDIPTLATLLKKQSYLTLGFPAGYTLHGKFGLKRGFDVYQDFQLDVQNELPAGQIVDNALAYMDKIQQSSFFLFLHFFDPHARYAPPHPFDLEYRACPYDGEIAYVDAQIGRIFTYMERRGLWRNTIVVLTSDHGEGLGENGDITHTSMIYNGTVHVPLICYFPGIPPGRRADNVSIVDIAPTVLERLGLQHHAKAMDGSPLPINHRQDRQRVLYLESLYGRLHSGLNGLRGLIKGNDKYIQSYPAQLYDLSQDFQERNNICSRGKEKEYNQALCRLIPGLVGPYSISERFHGADSTNPEELESLMALGYLAGSQTPDAELQETVPAQPAQSVLEPSIEHVLQTIMRNEFPAYYYLYTIKHLAHAAEADTLVLLPLIRHLKDTQAWDELLAMFLHNENARQTLHMFFNYNLELAKLYQVTGRHAKALAILDTMETSGLELSLARADILLDIGKGEQALPILADVQAQYPNNLDIKDLLARCHSQQDSRESVRRMVTDFTRGGMLKQATAHRLAVYLLAQKAHRLGTALLETALSRWPDDSSLHGMLADFHRLAGNEHACGRHLFAYLHALDTVDKAAEKYARMFTQTNNRYFDFSAVPQRYSLPAELVERVLQRYGGQYRHLYAPVREKAVFQLLQQSNRVLLNLAAVRTLRPLSAEKLKGFYNDNPEMFTHAQRALVSYIVLPRNSARVREIQANERLFARYAYYWSRDRRQVYTAGYLLPVGYTMPQPLNIMDSFPYAVQRKIRANLQVKGVYAVPHANEVYLLRNKWLYPAHTPAYEPAAETLPRRYFRFVRSNIEEKITGGPSATPMRYMPLVHGSRQLVMDGKATTVAHLLFLYDADVATGQRVEALWRDYCSQKAMAVRYGSRQRIADSCIQQQYNQLLAQEIIARETVAYLPMGMQEELREFATVHPFLLQGASFVLDMRVCPFPAAGIGESRAFYGSAIESSRDKWGDPVGPEQRFMGVELTAEQLFAFSEAAYRTTVQLKAGQTALPVTVPALKAFVVLHLKEIRAGRPAGTRPLTEIAPVYYALFKHQAQQRFLRHLIGETGRNR